MLILYFINQPESTNTFYVWGIKIDLYTLEAIIAGMAIMSVLVSIIAVAISSRSNALNKKMFKRQGVIDLYMAWQGVNNIDISNLITPDVVKAVNAISLTSLLWNHDIVEKNILYQGYSISFNTIYNTLDSSTQVVPGTAYICRSLLTPEIRKCYRSMQEFDAFNEIETNL